MSNDQTRRDALQWLTRRDYCKQEIMQKLKQKGHDFQSIAHVIANLTEVGLIDDKRYTENYIRMRSNKGFGPTRIALELNAKGIDAELIADHMNITDNVWLEHALRIRQKRFKGEIPTGFDERMKQMRYLQFRGFTQAQIEYVMKDREMIVEE